MELHTLFSVDWPLRLTDNKVAIEIKRYGKHVNLMVSLLEHRLRSGFELWAGSLCYQVFGLRGFSHVVPFCAQMYKWKPKIDWCCLQPCNLLASHPDWGRVWREVWWGIGKEILVTFFCGVLTSMHMLFLAWWATWIKCRLDNNVLK